MLRLPLCPPSATHAIAVVLALAGGAQAASPGTCVSPGQWVVPAGDSSQKQDPAALLRSLAQRPVVLLGEAHDNPEHHRWQLHTIAALYAYRPNMVLGFEMFPRRLQPVLDQWVAGGLSEAQFLERSEWRRVWGYDPQLYLPILHFARMHRVAALALNVERSLVSRVRGEGWQAIPPAEREGVDDPAPATPRYRATLYPAWLAHLPADASARHRHEPDYTDPDFVRFVEGMLVWDRAMAQAIARSRRGADPPLVVAIMGGGHLKQGEGVPHQLRDLGIDQAAVLMPSDIDEDCVALTPGFADAVFGVVTSAETAPVRPRLGIALERAPGGVIVREVIAGSLAEQTGIRAGDLILGAAGSPVTDPGDLIEAVKRQPPGTWLPLKIERNGESLELVAHFPPAQ